MPAKTAMLTLALALSILVPATTAQLADVVDAGPPVDAVVGGVAPTVPADAAGLPDVPADVTTLPTGPLTQPLEGATSLVDDTVDVSLSAQGAGVEVGLGTSSSAVASEPSSLGDRAAEVAVPVAGAGLVALGLGAVAFGLESLRGLQSRLVNGLGRVLGGIAGAIPLFSRIEREGVLDNPVRARVHDAIAQEPGLSLSDVAQRAGIAWGTAVHHLRRLESHGLVVSTREFAHHRYFIANTPAAAQRAAVVAVMHPTARRIAEYVSQRPGTDQAGLCRALGLNNPAASKHLGQFESRGLVLSQRSGRSRLYHPTGGLHAVLGLLEPASVVGTARPATPTPVVATATVRPMITVGAT